MHSALVHSLHPQSSCHHLPLPLSVAPPSSILPLSVSPLFTPTSVCLSSIISPYLCLYLLYYLRLPLLHSPPPPPPYLCLSPLHYLPYLCVCISPTSVSVSPLLSPPTTAWLSSIIPPPPPPVSPPLSLPTAALLHYLSLLLSACPPSSFLPLYFLPHISLPISRPLYHLASLSSIIFPTPVSLSSIISS